MSRAPSEQIAIIASGSPVAAAMSALRCAHQGGGPFERDSEREPTMEITARLRCIRRGSSRPADPVLGPRKVERTPHHADDCQAGAGGLDPSPNRVLGPPEPRPRQVRGERDGAQGAKTGAVTVVQRTTSTWTTSLRLAGSRSSSAHPGSGRSQQSAHPPSSSRRRHARARRFHARSTSKPPRAQGRRCSPTRRAATPEPGSTPGRRSHKSPTAGSGANSTSVEFPPGGTTMEPLDGSAAGRSL